MKTQLNIDHDKIVHQVSLETYTEKDIINAVIEAYYDMINKGLEKVETADPESYPRIMIPLVGTIYCDRPLLKRKMKIKQRREQKLKQQLENGEIEDSSNRSNNWGEG